MEQWKDIKDYQGLYMISDIGRVKSLGRTMILPTGGILNLKERILRQRVNKGYMIVGLSKRSKKFSVKVHRLVAEAFIENPENKKQVNHKFGNKKDNRVISLEWATGHENMKHSFANGFHVSPAKKGESNGRSKLTNSKVKRIRALSLQGKSLRVLGEKYKVSSTLIAMIIKRKAWSHV